jgi:hypothetical protein
VKRYRSSYPPETVYALRDMISKHYANPHRFVAITDHPEELTGVETYPLWDDWAHLPSVIGHSYPSCYRRLKLFHPETGTQLGERVVSIDLDTVIVKDISPIVDRDEDFMIWGESDFQRQACCGSLFMLKTGTNRHVWDEFKGEPSVREFWAAGCRGSDQGWLSYVFGVKHGPWDKPRWSRDDGVFSYRKHIAKYGNALPKEARLVSFHGKLDPWTRDTQRRAPWIKEHYGYRMEKAS